MATVICADNSHPATTNPGKRNSSKTDPQNRFNVNLTQFQMFKKHFSGDMKLLVIV